MNSNNYSREIQDILKIAKEQALNSESKYLDLHHLLYSIIFRPNSNVYKILVSIGCEIIELDCNLDYNFPKYNPNPEDIKMLHDISESVKKNKADIGFGFDGDGDRVGVIDNNGNEIYSDKVGLIIARNLAQNYKNKKFVVDVKSTGLLRKIKPF